MPAESPCLPVFSLSTVRMLSDSPFRYPGGKNRLIGEIGPRIDAMLANGCKAFADVFVGGGSVLCDVAANHTNIHLFANDKDSEIASFWSVVSGESEDDFRSLVSELDQPATIDRYNEQRLLQKKEDSPVQKAFWALFFNRTSFSGILRGSPIGGKQQKSKWKVNCRYNREAIKKKIVILRNLLKGRLTVTNADVLDTGFLGNPDVALYLDPPYVDKGHMLYTVSMDKPEHEALAKRLMTRGRWLLSYDSHPLVRSLYSRCKIEPLAARYSVNGEKDKWESKTELLISPRSYGDDLLALI